LNSKIVGVPYDAMRTMTLRMFDSILIVYMESEASAKKKGKDTVRNATQADIDAMFGSK